ncbi:type II toxin-antitoxin system HicA family toxin [Aromatoleum evansii]|uniref:type II toxin-antitoxin system HicA family toxin n=1 Tax=Aromatoleum evansii TaxID=59406 RepID=UPI001FE46BAF|nr:type II toxin-antitoxin system HicA family toxin [Aromatoleum evansii]
MKKAACLGSIFRYHKQMNATHRKTLIAIFTDPVSKSLEWRRIEALLVAIGCQVIEGNGSRVRFEKDGIIGTFHRPHPEKEAKPYQVRDARQFLENLGVKP